MVPRWYPVSAGVHRLKYSSDRAAVSDNRLLPSQERRFGYERASR